MFLSSHWEGRVMTTQSGSQSAARMTTSTSLFVMDFSSSFTPFLTCLRGSSCWSSSRIFFVSLGSAIGSGLRIFSTMTGFFYFSASPRMSMNSYSCSTFSDISFNYINFGPDLNHAIGTYRNLSIFLNVKPCILQFSSCSQLHDYIYMTSIDLYDQLVNNLDTRLLASERESRQSLRDVAKDEFQILVKQIRHSLDEVRDNNQDILRLKDKLVVNARQDKQTEICEQIKKICDANYGLLTQMREKLMAATKIVQNQRKQSPNEPQTFSKIYRKQHLAEEVDKMLNQSYNIQKLVQRFSVDTTLKRIRLVLPDISDKQAQKLIKEPSAFGKALTMKMTGKASLRLKYAHEDILSKARSIMQLEASVQQNLKLMKEVSLLVFQQGEMIDNILKNVTEAKDYIGKAVVKLQEQQKKHKSTRKKMCCIIFIALVVLALIAVPVVLTIVKRNSSSNSSPSTPTNDTTPTNGTTPENPTNDTNTSNTTNTTDGNKVNSNYYLFPID